MNTREEVKRKEKVFEYVSVAHLACFLMLYIFILQFIYKKPIPLYALVIINLSIIFILSIATIYVYQNLSNYSISTRLMNAVNILYTIFPMVLSFLLLTLTDYSVANLKIILLIPIIIIASSWGKIWGLAAAGTASLFLLIVNVIQMGHLPVSKLIETDSINVGVMFITAWLIGGLTDLEKNHRNYLTELANTDELSGLYNHRYFQEQLQYYTTGQNKADAPVSLIIMDVDYFKFYNDTFGHQHGDEIIKQLGSIINETIKHPSIAARYGGDEFVILLPGINGLQAVEAAETLRRKIEKKAFWGNDVMPGGKLTVSMGVASYPENAHNSKELLKKADQALYKAKFLKKNKVELYFSVFDDLWCGLGDSDRDLLNSVKTLVTVINAKDRYTYGHSERVMSYAVKLGKAIGIHENELKLLEYSAYLHDIGKIEIERSILNKTGPLSHEERNTLKQHPRWGSDIVKPIWSLNDIASVIMHHHENYNGSGYPDGLAGEQIPLLARILRIVDSYDAMTTDRPYKKAMTPFEAIKEILQCAGTDFDPDLAQTFVKIAASEIELNSNEQAFLTRDLCFQAR